MLGAKRLFPEFVQSGHVGHSVANYYMEKFRSSLRYVGHVGAKPCSQAREGKRSPSFHESYLGTELRRIPFIDVLTADSLLLAPATIPRWA